MGEWKRHVWSYDHQHGPPRRRTSGRHDYLAGGQGQNFRFGNPRFRTRNPPKRYTPGSGQNRRGGWTRFLLSREKIQSCHRIVPKPPEQPRLRYRSRQESEIVQFEDLVQILAGKIARRSRAMPVLNLRVSDEHRSPSLAPAAKSEIQIFHVRRFVNFIHSPESYQLFYIVERTATAAVQHIARVFAGHGNIAAHRKIVALAVRDIWHHSFASLLAALAVREKNLRRRTKEVRNFLESVEQRREKSRFDDHVVVEQTYMGVARPPDAGIHCAGERERFRMHINGGLWICCPQKLRRSIAGPVVHDDDLAPKLVDLPHGLGQQPFQQNPPVAAGDHHGDPARTDARGGNFQRRWRGSLENSRNPAAQTCEPIMKWPKFSFIARKFHGEIRKPISRIRQ